MSTAFRFRLRPVLDDRERREDLAQRELADAVSALARQREAAVTAERMVDSHAAYLRELAGSTSELWRLRSGHDAMAAARRRADHERATAARLDEVATARRVELVKASQDREALAQLERTQRERHVREARRVEAARLDEIAAQRSRRGTFGGESPVSTDDNGMVLMP